MTLSRSLDVPRVEPGRLASVHATLLDWYARHGRDLPWRHTRDPYTILVSEIMLQQTQVERVRPKLTEWLAAFPTFAALAAAPLAEVIRVWKGLGYNRRAVRLHAIARAVMERFGGRLPDTPAGLRELEGLGAYTANAVACFAYGAAVPVVDTNVRRVLGRVFADVLGLDPPAGRRLEAFAESVLPRAHAYEWNQVLMDIGATVCTARNPDHDACPVALQCAGRTLLPSRADLLRAAEDAPEYRAVPPTRAVRSKAGRASATPFEQTTRYFRGRIVDHLRALPPGETASLDELGQALRPDYGPEHAAWVEELVAGLRRDGLAATTEGADGPRVSLP